MKKSSLFLKTIFLFFVILSVKAQTLTKIPVSGYNHVGLYVKDLAVSGKFYQEVIGLTPLEVPDNLKAIRRWFVLPSGEQLHLLLGRKEPVTNNDKNGGHYSWTIPANSADAIEAYLKEKNLAYHRQQRFDGAYQIYITDPDGYVIELNEPKK